MSSRVIEGKWEEVVQREDLRGRNVRVQVLDEAPAAETREQWVKRLREWAESHARVDHFVDDSREAIYGGTMDDPR